MNYRYIILTVSWILLSSTYFFQASEINTTIEPPFLEIKDIDLGEVVAPALKVYNKSTKPLEITRIKPSCSCIQVKDQRLTVDSNSSILVPLKVNVGTKPNIRDYTLSFFTTDFKKPFLVYPIKIRPNKPINPTLSLYPPKVYLVFYEGWAEANSSFYIRNLGSKNLNVELTTRMPSLVLPSSKIEIKPGMREMFRLQYKAVNLNGKKTIQGEVLIKSNDHKREEVSVPVLITVR